MNEFEKTVAGAPYADKEIDVYLIGGQSNGTGYGLDDLAAFGYTDPRLHEGFESVLLWGGWDKGPVAICEELPKDFVPVRVGLGNKPDRSGAELGIASAVCDTGRTSAIIKYAWGASFLGDDNSKPVSLFAGTWTPPSYIKTHDIPTNGTKIGVLYHNFLATVKVGLDRLKEKGFTPVVKGLWWMQGEADSCSSQYIEAYEELLTVLISDLRKELSEAVGEDLSKLPVGIGKIRYNDADETRKARVEEVRKMQDRVAKKLENVFTVDPCALTGRPLQQDAWHFYASVQLWLGEKFVEGLRNPK